MSSWSGSEMLVSAFEEFMTPELLERARRELGETPEVQKRALRELRDLLDDEPNLNPKSDDKFLLRYLRARKYDVTKAFKTLRNFYTFKAKYAGRITDFTPSQLKHVLEMKCIATLPYREPGGSPVGLVRAGLYDESRATAEEFIATSLLSSEAMLDHESTLICGSVVIADMKGLTTRKMLQFSSATIISLFVSSFQDCVACRVKAIHVVNEPYFFTVLFKLVKKCLHKKITERVFFHGKDLNSLHKHMPMNILPDFLGGHLKLNDAQLMQYMLNKEKYFEDFNQYGYTSTNNRLQHKRLSFCL